MNKPIMCYSKEEILACLNQTGMVFDEKAKLETLRAQLTFEISVGSAMTIEEILVDTYFQID